MPTGQQQLLLLSYAGPVLVLNGLQGTRVRHVWPIKSCTDKYMRVQAAPSTPVQLQCAMKQMQCFLDFAAEDWVIYGTYSMNQLLY